MSLYVKLDTSYADDEKVILAGERAEVLYVRSLCLAKRILSDGFIADAHLPRFGLPSHAARAKKLCEVGLWRRDDAAGGYWIVSWLKHNPSAREVDRKRSKASEDGALGNHRRWHVEEGQPNEECDFCREEGRVGDVGAEPSPDRQPDSGTGSGTRSPETESESESESEKTLSDAASGADPVSRFGQQPVDLARHLGNRVQANGHKVPAKGSKAAWAWFDAIDKLLRLDGAKPAEVRAVIDWSTDDEFWKANIRSAGKLREQYSSLRLRMLNDGGAAPQTYGEVLPDGTRRGVM